ncbi:hypothetical protein [Erysipelothrix tonsillarum]|uniref:hypothetical protein n=1 Tax=Erysipelothrix tonsillarum TaxID=38402 RepID=UPI00036817A3|nr:hypothetical protein [Erysipelothrix tonsillarum]
MESTRQALQRRGYLDLTTVTYYANLSDDALLEQLQAENAHDRTAAVHVGARRWNYEPWFVDLLLKQLVHEEALYTRLEICRVLEDGNNDVAAAMIPYLGTIGRNQHQSVPATISRKTSYPLPRDLIARTLGNMNASILYTMIDHLDSLNRQQLSEMIDAYGYLISKHPHLATEAHLKIISYILSEHDGDELIIWKCMQCLSAFPLDNALKLLQTYASKVKHPTTLLEINRSIALISKQREVI